MCISSFSVTYVVYTQMLHLLNKYLLMMCCKNVTSCHGFVIKMIANRILQQSRRDLATLWMFSN